MLDDELEERLPNTSDRFFTEGCSRFGYSIATDPSERLWRMVRGYRAGADALVDKANRTSIERRDLIYPIIFLYRHALELHLKQIIIDYGDAANVKPDFTDYRLDRLWQKCRQVLLHFMPEGEEETLKIIGVLVAEFTAVDGQSTTFRYPTDAKGVPLSLALNDPDLEHLRSTMAGVANFLECCEIELHERSNESW